MELQKLAHNIQIFDTNADVAFLGYKTPLYGYELKIIVVVAKTDKQVDEFFIREFSSAAMNYVSAIHGNSGHSLTACINILIGANISPSSIKFSKKSLVSTIGKREIPVIYDINHRKHHTFDWFNPWGFAHAYYYLRTIKQVIALLEERNFNLFPETT